MSIAQRVAARYKNKKKVKNQDGKEQVVYEYSDRQVQNRNREKAEKLEGLRKGYNKLVKQVKTDLKAKDEKKRLTALAVALINDTYERVGNAGSAKEGHYGVTGWMVKHITFGKGDPVIEYIGKSGVEQRKTVTDKAVSQALEACCKGRDGKESIFKTDGNSVNSKAVNDYLKPFDVTAKDLRGLAANKEMQRTLKEQRKSGGKLPSDPKEREKKLKQEFKDALEEAAEAVGHTTSILRSSYLVPGLEDEFMKDGKVNTNLKKAQQRVPFDAAKVAAFRKDFLTLMRNVKRLKDYKTTERWRKAVQQWREYYEDYIFKHFLDALTAYRWQGVVDEGWAKEWEKKIRSSSWDLVTNLSPPLDAMGYVKKYSPWETEESVFASFLHKAPQWERRVKRYARIAWTTLNEFFEWWAARKSMEFEVKLPAEEQVTLEGFNCRLLGYDRADKFHRKGMDQLTAGLRIFRQRAAKTFPWILKHMLPLVVNFRATLDAFGRYHHTWIEIFPSGGESPGNDAHALAHEMGHHIYQTYLSGDKQKLWRKLIRGTTGEFDVRELLKMWPDNDKFSQFEDSLLRDNPVMYLQLQTLYHDPSYKHYDLLFRGDFEKYLEAGNDPILYITTKPISGYAATNVQEAFCETVGLLCAYGPRTVDPQIREWFRILIPNWRFAGSGHRVAKRVVARFLAAQGVMPFPPEYPNSP